MSAITFVSQNGFQLALCALLAFAAWCTYAHRTARPWNAPYTPDRPERHGDLGALDHRAGKHERGERA